MPADDRNWITAPNVPKGREEQAIKTIVALNEANEALRASHTRLVSACNLALPFLWNAPLEGAIEAFEKVRFARNAAMTFEKEEDHPNGH